MEHADTIKGFLILLAAGAVASILLKYLNPAFTPVERMIVGAAQ